MKRILAIFVLSTIIILGLNGQSNQLEVDMIPAVNEAAIQAVANNDQVGRTYGVRGISNGTDGVGVFGSGNTGLFAQGAGFGVFASGSFRAGSFAGNLEYTGMLIGPSSDEKLKTFIKNETSYLSILNQMNIRKYKYKTNEYPTLNLSERVQYGLVAQELEKVMPELIFQSKTISMPANEKPNTENIEYKSINYLGLLPVAIASIQELTALVKAQSAEIETLKEQVSLLKD